jgi:hypothetical protein
MAKIKAVRGAKKKKKSIVEALPCLFLLVMGIGLISLLFYSIVSSAK